MTDPDIGNFEPDAAGYIPFGNHFLAKDLPADHPFRYEEHLPHHTARVVEDFTRDLWTLFLDDGRQWVSVAAESRWLDAPNGRAVGQALWRKLERNLAARSGHDEVLGTAPATAETSGQVTFTLGE